MNKVGDFLNLDYLGLDQASIKEMLDNINIG